MDKEKYKKLMDEKIRIERERNKIFLAAQKLVKIIQDSGLDIDLSEFKGIKNQAGVSLIPGDGEITNLKYEPFNNYF